MNLSTICYTDINLLPCPIHLTFHPPCPFWTTTGRPTARGRVKVKCEGVLQVFSNLHCPPSSAPIRAHDLAQPAVRRGDLLPSAPPWSPLSPRNPSPQSSCRTPQPLPGVIRIKRQLCFCNRRGRQAPEVTNPKTPVLFLC